MTGEDGNLLKGIHVTEMMAADVPFLLDLWSLKEGMRYADEFPHPRGWTRRDDVETAWASYRQRRKIMGDDYSQLILRLGNRAPVGESFRFPLDNRFSFGQWRKPMELRTTMTDIKVHPDQWGKGLGTSLMRLVVEHVFSRTKCQLLVVPPNKKNPAAIRVYEKAGFTRARPLSVHQGQYIMELPRERFDELYRS
jgi:RimJ/RimL family protein N-acetyltransferase